MGRNAKEEIERRLQVMRQDFRLNEGRPFEYFFCPMLLLDEKTELCMAHIVNQAIKGSFRDWVVQRKDVDGFYGSVFESDFTALVQAKESGQAFFDDVLRKKMETQIIINGEECPHYETKRRNVPPTHTAVQIDSGGGKIVDLVFRKPREELLALGKAPLEVRMGRDFSLSGLVSVIKAAYLTMFRLRGYKYALSLAGMQVGNAILGKFYEECSGKEIQEIRERAVKFFQPYVNMARPIVGYTGAMPKGTVEDRMARLCCIGRKPYAVIVCVRAASQFFAVMLPIYDDAEGVSAYHAFMTGETEKIWTHHCYFDPAKRDLVAEEIQSEAYWPKSDQNILKI
jgi:hypothetical protein